MAHHQTGKASSELPDVRNNLTQHSPADPSCIEIISKLLTTWPFKLHLTSTGSIHRSAIGDTAVEQRGPRHYPLISKSSWSTTRRLGFCFDGPGSNSGGGALLNAPRVERRVAVAHCWACPVQFNRDITS
jgi:hypothetical protein